MQQNKVTNNFSELKEIIADPEKLTSSLTDVVDKFDLKKHFSLFDGIKTKGLLVSNLLNILVMLPFHGVSSIYALFKNGLTTGDFQGKKDVYYEIKNNENISWRTILFLMAKRFNWLINKNIKSSIKGITALIFDDTLIEKTGKKIERISVVNDHVSHRFILGFKLLVCGFWDGSSFIPLDFSLHREKGSKQDKLIDAFKKANKTELNTQSKLESKKQALQKKDVGLKNAQLLFKQKATKTNKARLDNLQFIHDKLQKEMDVIQKEFEVNKKQTVQCKRDIKKHYAKDTLFGLTAKERKEQHKKVVSKDSYGNIRRREADTDKISAMITMLKRVVKNGFIADYVLSDSWFFCYELLKELKTLKKGIIKLVSMVKINNQLFTDIKGKKMAVKYIPDLYQKQTQTCRKLKAQYIKVPCFYQGIRVNLFFVKIGKSTKWHLLLTTDLDIHFIKLMEVYQIRWSIEVFFKESKQYLNLENCKSTIFDAHITDITISMIQHIMLTYFKRLHYMQSIGDLFEKVSRELVELNLIRRLLNIFWELVEIFCDNAGFDFIEFQEDAINNDAFCEKIIKLLPDRTMDKAA